VKRLQISGIFWRFKNSLFVRQVSVTFITRTAIVVISFALNIVTARCLGPAGRGILAVLMTIVALASQFGNLGLHASNTYYAAKDKEKLPNIIGNTIWIGFLGGIIISLVTWLIFSFKQDLIKGVPGSFLLIAIFSIPFSLLFLLGQNILLGIQEIKTFNVLEFSKSLIIFVFTAILLIIYKLGVEGVLIPYTVFSIIFCFILLKKLLILSKKLLFFDFFLFQQSLIYGFKAYWSAFFSFLALKFNMLMVNYFLGTQQTGIYSISVQVGDFIYLLPTIIGVILFSRVSGMKEGSWQFTKKIILMTSGIMLLAVLITTILAKPLIILLYGNDFQGAVSPLLWLLPGIFFLSINTIFMNFFAGRGNPMIVVISPLLAFTANFVLNICLIPSFGINGSSFTSSLTYLIMLVASFVYLKFNPNVLSN
jgi:O-antigen/teichoic acid export membrane protein